MLVARSLRQIHSGHRYGSPHKPRFPIVFRAPASRSFAGCLIWSRYGKRVPHFVPLGSPSPSPSSRSEPISDLLGKLEFTDGYGGLAFALAALLALIGFFVWWVRAARKRKDEPGLVTSDYRLLGGMNNPFTYEISVHNATPHPLRMVEVRYWDGAGWQLRLVRSSQTGDPVVRPGDTGIASMPAMTTDLSEFDNFYFLRYTDSRNRIWNRRISSPDFLSRDEVRQLERFHGTI